MIRPALAIVGILFCLAGHAEECGTANKPLMAPFAGSWRDGDGDILSIGLGTMAALGQAELALGKAPQAEKVVPQDQPSAGPDEISLDCTVLDAASVRALLQELEEFLTDEIGDPEMTDEESALDEVRRRLRHPPYSMLTVKSYESRDYMILAGDGELLDLSTAEASLTLRRYRKVPAHH